LFVHVNLRLIVDIIIFPLSLFLAVIMNVAALLQDSPSEDTTNRRRPPDNSSQRPWHPSSSPQQQPSSAPTSSWAPTSSSGIHDRPSPHWQERDRRLSNPTLVGPATGVPPSPYIHSGTYWLRKIIIIFIFIYLFGRNR
jgi:hypothetical protein